MFRAKLSTTYRDFPCVPLTLHEQPPPTSTSLMRGPFVTIYVDRHWPTIPKVLIRVHSCCWPLCEFEQMSDDMYPALLYHTRWFHCPKNPSVPRLFPSSPAYAFLFLKAWKDWSTYFIPLATTWDFLPGGLLPVQCHWLLAPPDHSCFPGARMPSLQFKWWPVKETQAVAKSLLSLPLSPLSTLQLFKRKPKVYT